MSNYKDLAAKIMEAAGGKGNIDSVTNCATRLRMYIKDAKQFDTAKMKRINGVMGVQLSGGQHQIIVGPTAIHVCREIQDAYGIADAAGEKKKQVSGNKFNQFLETISGCIAPVVPALIASGLIKVILNLLTMTNIMAETSQTYALLSFASDAVFYFLPMLLAYTTAKRFKCNEVLAIIIAGVMLHPQFVALVGELSETGDSLKFFGLPVTLTGYDGSVVPIILTIWVMSYVEKFIDKILPKVVIHLFRPLLIVLLMTPIALIVTGPAGAIFGQGLSIVLQAIFAKAGWLAIGLTLLVTSVLCMTGMHLALIPVAMTSIAETGYDEFVLVVFLCFTLSQGAAALAALLKTKNSTLRQLALPAAISGLFGGTSEPALYGISVKMKRPLYATIIGSTAAGIYAGIVHLKVFDFGLFSLLGIPGYQSAEYASNMTHAIITSAIAVFGTMIAVWVLGFDDSVYDEEDETEEKAIPNIQPAEIVSAATGDVIPMKDIKDDVFSAGVVGAAIGVSADEGICYAPVDGVAATVFHTKHAIGFRSNDGAEVLLHVGIDSVNLNGEGLKVFIQEGDVVKQGQKILEFDQAVFKKNQLDDTVILVVSNSHIYREVTPVKEQGRITAGDPIFRTNI